MNDYADLTDELNEILEGYAYDDAGVISKLVIMDLDSWASADVQRVQDIMLQVRQMRSEQITVNVVTGDPEFQEWAESFDDVAYDDSELL